MPEDKTRRGFLTAAGAGAVTVLAGCSSGPSGNTTTTTTSGSGTDSGNNDGGNNDGGGGNNNDGGNTTTTTSSGGGDSMSGGGTLQMMAPGSIQTLDPINAKGSGAGYDQYGRSVMEFKNGLYPPKPALAKDYTVSDDGLTYTFKLKEGVKFHNGEELTAKDCVYSYRRLAGSPNTRNADDIIGETMTIKHKKNKSRSTPSDEATLGDYVPGSLAVRAKDKYTFEFELVRPFQYTLFQIAGGAFAVLPENSVGDIKGYDGKYDYNEFFSTKNDGPTYAGLGPFKLDSWTKGSNIKLTAFEDYYEEGAPKLDGITYTVVGSGNARLQRFKNENAHILEGMPTASFNPDKVTINKKKGSRSIGTYKFDSGMEVNYGEIPALETEYFVFNTKKVPIPVRKAFAYALNQHEVARNVYKGNAKAAYHITPPDPYPTFEDGVSSLQTYDRHAENGYQSMTKYGKGGYPYGYGETRIDDAKKVMEDAGYGPNNKFKLTATNIQGNSAYGSILKRLQSKLRAAHIDMTIETAEFGTIISRAIKGSMEVFSLGDGMEYPGPQNFLRFLWGGNPSSAFTRWGAKGSNYQKSVLQTAKNAWQNNYQPKNATQADKNKAFQIVEETNWASMQELPTVHPTTQRFWHKYVDVEMFGVMENQTFTDVTINK